MDIKVDVNDTVNAHDLSNCYLFSIDDDKASHFDDAIHIKLLRNDIFEIGFHCHNPLVIAGQMKYNCNQIYENVPDIMFSFIVYIDKNSDVIRRKCFFQTYAVFKKSIKMSQMEKILKSPVFEDIKKGKSSNIVIKDIDKEFNDIELSKNVLKFIKVAIKINDTPDASSIMDDVYIIARQELGKMLRAKYGELSFTFEDFSHPGRILSLPFRSPHRKLSSYCIIKQTYAMITGAGENEMMDFIVSVSDSDYFKNFIKILVEKERDQRSFERNYKELILYISLNKNEFEANVQFCILNNELYIPKK